MCRRRPSEQPNTANRFYQFYQLIVPIPLKEIFQPIRNKHTGALRSNWRSRMLHHRSPVQLSSRIAVGQEQEVDLCAHTKYQIIVRYETISWNCDAGRIQKPFESAVVAMLQEWRS